MLAALMLKRQQPVPLGRGIGADAPIRAERAIESQVVAASAGAIPGVVRAFGRMADIDPERREVSGEAADETQQQVVLRLVSRLGTRSHVTETTITVIGHHTSTGSCARSVRAAPLGSTGTLSWTNSRVHRGQRRCNSARTAAGLP